MAVKSTTVLDADDLNDVDRQLLDELAEGRGTPKFLSERISTDRSYVSQRLKRLSEHDHIEKLETGLYELVDDPRHDAAEDDVDLEALRAALLEAKSAHADVRGDDLAEALDRALKLLGEDVE
ncbi:hypothetical protein [Halobaculum sp. EA56]|uniref:hypothetical protein n=1 Tax=Halobaculum sp. EA56 TaxID=3421648 RepID=UPI003EBC4AB7